MEMFLANSSGLVLDLISFTLQMASGYEAAIVQFNTFVIWLQNKAGLCNDCCVSTDIVLPPFAFYFLFLFVSVALILYHKSTWLQASHSASGLPM